MVRPPDPVLAFIPLSKRRIPPNAGFSAAYRSAF
jgi:hypothetical protein